MEFILRCRSSFPDPGLHGALRGVRRALALALALAVGLAVGGGDAACASDASARTQALIQRGEARRLDGRLGAALDDLTAAHALAPTPAERAFAAAALGVALSEAGRAGPAAQRLREAIDGAAGMPAVTAVARATLAALSVAAAPVEVRADRDRRLAAARAALARAESEAAVAAIPAVAATVAAAQARVAGMTDDPAGGRAALARGLDALAGADDAPARRAALGLGAVALEIEPFDAAAAALADRAHAMAAGEDRIGALAALGLGESALRRGDPARARAQAGRAARHASATASDDIGFQADWLMARATARQGDVEGARAAYDAAFDGLQGFRQRSPLGAPPATAALGAGERRFQLDFIDFLLTSGVAPDREQARLAQVLRLAEDVKLDEVDEYFDERCAPARGATAPAEALARDVAVLYPVTFEDRLEIVASVGGRLERRTAPIGRGALRQEVALLRLLIDAPRASPRDQARRLYDLLIAPLAPAMEAAGITTLVVAPDGPLRALPFAALWDGERWLGERYGLATILSLNLVQQSDFDPGTTRVLAAGARDPSPDYPPLPAVADELAAISEIFDTRVLLDGSFTVEALADDIARRGFGVVHIATHAEFGPDPADNFIIAPDGRLDIGRIEAIMRVRAVRDDTPVDLLTLSACNTAAAGGEVAERAPLGLASVGFRAGARTVVASLWPAEDRATAQLMERFYEELRAGAGRAEALRRAQASLIARPDTADPFQWANFILIGDWR